MKKKIKVQKYIGEMRNFHDISNSLCVVEFLKTLAVFNTLLSSMENVSDEPCEAIEVPASELFNELLSASGTVRVT